MKIEIEWLLPQLFTFIKSKLLFPTSRLVLVSYWLLWTIVNIFFLVVCCVVCFFFLIIPTVHIKKTFPYQQSFCECVSCWTIKPFLGRSGCFHIFTWQLRRINSSTVGFFRFTWTVFIREWQVWWKQLRGDCYLFQYGWAYMTHRSGVLQLFSIMCIYSARLLSATEWGTGEVKGEIAGILKWFLEKSCSIKAQRW